MSPSPSNEKLAGKMKSAESKESVSSSTSSASKAQKTTPQKTPQKPSGIKQIKCPENRVTVFKESLHQRLKEKRHKRSSKPKRRRQQSHEKKRHKRSLTPKQRRRQSQERSPSCDSNLREPSRHLQHLKTPSKPPAACLKAPSWSTYDKKHAI